MALADALKQLAQLSPGIVAGLKGDGNAMKAFMDAYQQTTDQLDEQERRRQVMAQQGQDRTLAQQDRERLLARQTEADRQAGEDRQRKQALEMLSLPSVFAQATEGLDDVGAAESAIDSMTPTVAQAFGTEPDTIAPFRDQALRQVGQTITSRQKAQMRQFVDAALKTSFVADNPDADPELIELPAHIAKLVGTPTAKLSALQRFAELPVGKPSGKTRTPAAVGSLEDYIERKYGLNPTPEQITEGRRVYTEAGRTTPTTDPEIAELRKELLQLQVGRAKEPKPDGGLNPNQQALMTERLAKGWTDANTSIREMRRQYGLMQTGLKRFGEGDKNGGSQAVLVTFQKILDPTSVVRESEYARSAEGISLLSRLDGYLERLQTGGAGVPAAELAAMVETARQMLDGMQSYNATQRSRIDAMAKKYQIDPVLIYGVEASAGGGGGAPQADPLGIRPPKG